MSIINQVLNEIEQRQQQPQTTMKKLTALELVEPRSKWVMVGIGCVVLMVLSAGVFFGYQTWQSRLEAANTLAPAKVIAPPSLLLPDPKVEEQLKDRAREILISDQAKPKPKPKPKPVVAAIRVQAQTKLKTTTPVARPQQPLVELKVQQPSTPVIPQLSIKAVVLSASQLAKLKFKQAAEQQRQGFYFAAQDLWLESLELKADYHQAREQLALSLAGQRNNEQALTILNQGISQFPQYLHYQMIAANIYIQHNQREQALNVLNRPYQNQASSDQQLALAGSLAQQLQQWREAQLNFQLLVTRDDKNSTWLIGLAIALDGQGKMGLALTRYSQFILLPNNSSLLQDYALQRIQQLQAKQQRENNGKT